MQSVLVAESITLAIVWVSDWRSLGQCDRPNVLTWDLLFYLSFILQSLRQGTIGIPRSLIKTGGKMFNAIWLIMNTAQEKTVRDYRHLTGLIIYVPTLIRRAFVYRIGRGWGVEKTMNYPCCVSSMISSSPAISSWVTRVFAAITMWTSSRNWVWTQSSA